MEPNFASFIRFQGVLHDSGVLFSEFWNFYKLKNGDLISGGNQFCRKSELFGPAFCISVLKVLRTQILRHSLDFNAFCLIQEWLLKFGQIKVGGRNFWGEQIMQKVRTTWSFLLSFNLNVLWIQILQHTPPESRIFQWTSKILKFFILNTILSFKNNWILRQFPSLNF